MSTVGELSNEQPSKALLSAKSWSDPGEISVTAAGGREWHHRHSVIWSNDLIPGKFRKQKNSICSKTPVGLRSYFDRGRSPGIHRTDAGENFRFERKQLQSDWKLEGKPEPAVITSLSRPCLTPLQDPEYALPREERWHSRHQLTYNNEDLSPLSRSYFDRPRVPEALVDMSVGHSKGSSLIPTWRLSLKDAAEPGKDVPPSQADIEQKQREESWDLRHHIVWNNDFLIRGQRHEEKKMNPNFRSYFDRFLPPRPMKGSKQRQKLREEERLRPEWSLQDPRQGPGILRRTWASDPALLHRRKNWHARHGTEF